MSVILKPALFFLIPALLCLHALGVSAASGTADRGTAAELDRIIAVVNDDVILLSELDDFLRKIIQQLRSRGSRLPSLENLQRQALERMIIRRLQLQLAESTGVRVDDDTLNKAIRRIASQNQLSIDELRSALTQDGVDYAEFRQQIREEIILTKLKQRQVNNKVRVNDQEIQDYLGEQDMKQSAHVQYNYSHILVALPEAASPEQIGEKRKKAESILARHKAGEDFADLAISMSDGRKALEGGAHGWKSPDQLPTLFAGVLPDMKAGEISEPIQSFNGFHILKLNEIRGTSERHTVEQTLARHILIRTSEVVSDQEVKLRLEQLKLRAEGGDNFAELARAHSDDTLSAKEGGNLGWVSPGDMVPQFEQQMNETVINRISEPFRTQFGWHIVQVLDRQVRDNTEQYLENNARKILRNRKIQEMTEQWLRRLRDEAYIEYRLES